MAIVNTRIPITAASCDRMILALVEQYPRAMAKNVDFRYGDVLQMLTETGFKEITRQYEMVRDI